MPFKSKARQKKKQEKKAMQTTQEIAKGSGQVNRNTVQGSTNMFGQSGQGPTAAMVAPFASPAKAIGQLWGSLGNGNPYGKSFMPTAAERSAANPQPASGTQQVTQKRSELILQKYAGLICSLPDRKRDLVTAQLLYGSTTKTAEQRLIRFFASLPNEKQMKLAAALLVNKKEPFTKQAAEVMLWRRQIERIPQMLPIEKRAFWSGFIKTAGPLAAIPFLGKVIPWLWGGIKSVAPAMAGGAILSKGMEALGGSTPAPEPAT